MDVRLFFEETAELQGEGNLISLPIPARGQAAQKPYVRSFTFLFRRQIITLDPADKLIAPGFRSV
jgi:hypothetical protein